MDSPTKIYLDEAKELSVEVTFLNANHCPGKLYGVFCFLSSHVNSYMFPILNYLILF